MGLRKYDENSNKEQEIVENEVASEVEETTDKEAIIEENIPLNELQEQLEKKINDYRVEYLAIAKKQRKINYIVTGCVLAFLIAAFVLIIVFGNKINWVSYVSLAVMAIVLVTTFFISKFFKNKLSECALTYLDNLCKEENNYLYREDYFTEVESLPRQELVPEIFFDAHFYKDLKSTKSRNLVIAKYKGKNFTSADLAANILVKNRTAPLFLGKFYDFENEYKEKDKYILFQLKGGQLSKPLDNIDDLTLVEGNEIYSIYSNDQNWDKVLTKKVINEIKKFKVDSTLIDVILSIREGKTCIGIDYMDEFMNIPVNSEFKFDTFRRVEEDLIKVLSIVDLIK